MKEKVDAGTITRCLYSRFVNYDFLLANSFVFHNWESDFLAKSKSGYFIEVEVKISRGDFFKDFEKIKHGFFKSLHQKKTHHVEQTENWYRNRGDLICEFRSGKLLNGRHYSEAKIPPGVRQGSRQVNGKWIHGYWTNQDHYHLHIETIEVRAPVCSIDLHDLGKINLPNQFYYCCPSGLIKSTEIPEYAGLLEYKNGNLVQTKKAPYLHKRKFEMWQILAWKFSQLWRYKANHGIKYQS